MENKRDTLDYEARRPRTMRSRLNALVTQVTSGALIAFGIILAVFVFSGLVWNYQFRQAVARAKVNATQAELREVQDALASFKREFGRYPTTAEGLDALQHPPELNPPISTFIDRSPCDAWMQRFVYRVPGGLGAPYDLHSLGPDGIDGTADDIYSDPSPR